jgi:hypothetical protein
MLVRIRRSPDFQTVSVADHSRTQKFAGCTASIYELAPWANSDRAWVLDVRGVLVSTHLEEPVTGDLSKEDAHWPLHDWQVGGLGSVENMPEDIPRRKDLVGVDLQYPVGTLLRNLQSLAALPSVRSYVTFPGPGREVSRYKFDLAVNVNLLKEAQASRRVHLRSGPAPTGCVVRDNQALDVRVIGLNARYNPGRICG